jgi:C-terminal processing protease CtpA/Prc
MKKALLVVALVSSQLSRAQVPNTIPPAEKMYGLSRFWQEVNYNFVYLNKVNRVAWDSLYRQMITEVQATPNDYEYYRLLQRFCAFLNDGHTNVFMPQKKGFETMTTMFGDYRLFIENIDNKAIITRTNLSKKDEIPEGSEVMEVNGLSTEAYLKQKVMPYIASSTDYVLRDWATRQLLTGMSGDRFQIKIKTPDGNVKSFDLTHAVTAEKGVNPPFENDRGLLDFKWMDNQIAYVSLNSFDNPKIDSLFITRLPELYKAKGLIIDLRYNGGGSTTIGTNILQYLTKDKKLNGSVSSSRMHIPAHKAWGKFTQASDTAHNAWASKSLLMFQDNYFYKFDHEPQRFRLKAKRIVVPTALLIGHNTASAAEDFLIYADKQPHMTKIGENTFGSTGQPYLFDLPGGGVARVCTKKDTYPDGKEFVGYGVKPDIEVKRTADDFIKHRDPVLEKAVDYLKTKVK